MPNAAPPAPLMLVSVGHYTFALHAEDREQFCLFVAKCLPHASVSHCEDGSLEVSLPERPRVVDVGR